MGLILKAATSELDWTVAFELVAGETLGAPVWTVDPAEAGGMAVKAGSPVTNGGSCSAILTGGLFRRVYQVTVTATSNQGRKFVQTIGFRIGPVDAI